MTDTSEGNIKVVVRVRPLLPREDENSHCLVTMPESNPKITLLEVPSTSSFYQRGNSEETPIKKYLFDESIWSYNSNDLNYIDNKKFYDQTSPQIIDHVFLGFNVCYLAYGQTGSGKTHTMMGDPETPGLIPLLVKDLLRRREKLVNERINCQLKFLYMEVYNEQVKDLLGNDNNNKKCRVREHPITGPYVENLSEYNINNFQSFLEYLQRGNQIRSTAPTSMNDSSSRSHAIITLSVIQTKFKQTNDGGSDDDTTIGEADEEMISNIKLVDLAGSERLSKTKVFKQQDRLKEGTLINKSLTVLGRCINILSDTNNQNNQNNSPMVPYRDSVLTYILKENLSGNSKTFMLFCISPVDFEESYQTLNYATQVKKIRTKAKANKKKIVGGNKTQLDWSTLQDEDLEIVSDLKDEVRQLTEELQLLKLSSVNQHENDQEKWLKLTQFLESQTETVRFENKYLQHKLKQKSAEINELKNQVAYMYREVVEIVETSEQERKHMNKKMINRLANVILEQCLLGQSEVHDDINKFDPKYVF